MRCPWTGRELTPSEIQDEAVIHLAVITMTIGAYGDANACGGVTEYLALFGPRIPNNPEQNWYGRGFDLTAAIAAIREAARNR